MSVFGAPGALHTQRLLLRRLTPDDATDIFERWAQDVGLRVAGHRGEFGYAFARAAWGRGYATEAARAVVGAALAMPAIRRVWAYVDVDNVASARVLEKAGLTREGCLRQWFVPSGFAVPRDAWCYARVKEAA